LFYSTYTIRITDDGGQATGEVLRHVQMGRWSKHIGERSEQQLRVVRQRAMQLET